MTTVWGAPVPSSANASIWGQNLPDYLHFEITIDAPNSSCSISDEEKEKKKTFQKVGEFSGVEAL
jgi:hypothetical protein